MRSSLLIFILFMGCSVMHAGQQKNTIVFHAEEISTATRSSNIIDRSFTKYDLYKLNVQEINSYIKGSGVYSEFVVELGEGSEWQIELEAYDVRSEDYRLMVAENGKMVEYPRSPNGTYKGILNNDPNNFVRVFAKANKFSAFIKHGDQVYFLEQANIYDNNFSQDHFVVYKMTDIIEKETFVCGTKDSPAELKSPITPIEKLRLLTSDAACLSIMSGVAADYGWVKNAGGVQVAENLMLELFNMVLQIYEPLDVEYILNETFLPASQSDDPFTTSNDPYAVLNDFRAWADQGSFANYGSILIQTSKSMGGILGAANTGSICQSRTTAFNKWQGLSAKISMAKTWAHEWGHVWGCSHTGSSKVNVMAQGAGYSSLPVWTQKSANIILNAKATASCGQACGAIAPIADFLADNTSGCGSLTVKFTDNSKNSPTSWLWDFGDGNTSTEQNPTHTYNTGGTYTVKLKVTNENGDHTQTKTDLISLGSGTPYPSVNGGPADNTFGEGAYFSSTNERRLFFNAHEDVIIGSVKVYADQAGERAIEILDNAGKQVFVRSVDIPAGESRIQLDASISAGSNYAIKVASSLVNLYRNSNGPSYPYSINGMVTILKTDAASTPEAATQYYYFFYDWAVKKAGCQIKTGIADHAEKYLKVYPNPVKDIFNVELADTDAENLEIKLYDLIGDVVYEKNAGTILRNTQYQINLSGLASGGYLICIKTGDKIFRQKLIKE